MTLPEPSPLAPLPHAGEGDLNRRLNQVALAFALALLAVLAMACGGESEAVTTTTTDSTTTAPPRVVVAVETLTTQTVVDQARLPAELRPRRRATLAAEVSGTVETLTVDRGDRVRSGQPLMAVDTRDLEQRLAEAEAIERQRVAELERAAKLFERRSITAQQRLEAETARELARVQLASARLQLDKSKLVAPWSGTVATREVEVGDFVAPGQPVLTLLEVDRLEARAPAPASLVPHLAVGQTVRVWLDVLPDAELEGTIARLAAELDPATRTLDVDVELDNREGRLRPGMTARLEIPRQTLENVVVAPVAALVELEDRQVAFVAVGEGDTVRAERREVVLGPMLGDRVVVLDGLVARERLIVDGQQQVSPGQAVLVARPASATPASGSDGA